MPKTGLVVRAALTGPEVAEVLPMPANCGVVAPLPVGMAGAAMLTVGGALAL